MEHCGRRAASLPRFQLLSILSASVRIIPSSAILFYFFLLPPILPSIYLYFYTLPPTIPFVSTSSPAVM